MLSSIRSRSKTWGTCAWVLVMCAAACGNSRAAESPAADKSHYTLLNPTPAALLRELSTDRPDKTESPYTVDAGHFQVEADLFTFSQDRDTSDGADTRTDAWRFGVVNLKAGLCNWADLQLVLESYSSVRTDDRVADAVTRQSGFGDVALRFKANLWGNDGGPTAFAVMPFVKLPTNQDDLGNDAVEGGVIFPLAVELPGGWGMGLMTVFAFLENGSGSGYHAEYLNSVTLSHDIVGKLGGYVEFFSLVSAEDGAAWVGTVDLGFTYGLTKNIQLDAGVNIGVTRAADDVNPFLGFSVRF